MAKKAYLCTAKYTFGSNEEIIDRDIRLSDERGRQ